MNIFLTWLRRRVIFLPARQCDRAYQDELSSILAHELAHLKGGDLLWNAVLQALTNLLWFHPLAWRVRTTHADACDAVSDAIAAGYVGDATVYSRILARLTLRITAPSESVGLAMARTSCITRRIAAVRGHILCSALPGRSQQREQEFKFQLERRPRGGSLAGTVTDPDGKPIAGAIVRNVGNDPNQTREAKTDAQGRFVLNDLLEGLAGHEITVRARKFATLIQTVEPGREESPTPVSIHLEAGHSIRGRVLNRAGEPVKGAYVAANGFGDWGIGETVRTNDAGEFEFDSLPDGSKFTIQANGYPVSHDLALTLDQKQMVDVRLESMAVLRGRVVDAETRKPLQSFRIRGGFSKDRRQTDAKGSYPIALEGRGITFQPADGVFAVNDLTKGVPLEIGVEADGYERQVFRRVVPESDEADQIELVLLKKRDVAKLAGLVGTIIDRRGKPTADVQLRLIVTSEPATGEDDRQFNWALINSGQLGQRIYVDQYLSAVTGADGKFEFNELLPEKFLQIAFWGDAVPKSRTLDLDATEPGVRQSTTIQFSEPARIKASFDAALFPDAGEIQLNYDDDSLLSYKLKLADKQTKFEFGNLPPGRCSLFITAVPARHPDNPDLFTVRSLAKRRLTIEPGETYELEFTADDAAKPGQ